MASLVGASRATFLIALRRKYFTLNEYFGATQRFPRPTVGRLRTYGRNGETKRVLEHSLTQCWHSVDATPTYLRGGAHREPYLHY